MNYVIAQGVPPLVTYFSERAGRDYGAAGNGWVRSSSEATAFDSEHAAQQFIDRALFHEQAGCRVETRMEALPAPVDHYAILGLSRGASQAEIKRAFRRLAMQHHPDRDPDPQAATRFNAIRAAYEALRVIRDQT